MRISTTAAETLTTWPERERQAQRANEMNITLELHFALAMLGTVGYFLQWMNRSDTESDGKQTEI